MPRTPAPRGDQTRPNDRQPEGPALAEYARASRTPLHVLAFLLPLILIYEVGLALHHEELAASGGVRAWAMIAGAMETLGVSPSTVVGYSLPAAVIVVVLLLWHAFEKRRWKLKPLVVPLMFAEAVAWMVPLLLFAGVLTRLSEPVQAIPSPSPAPLVPASLDALGHLSWQARLVIAIGAGLYEELLFRMALLALLHAVLADLCRLRPGVTVAIALPISAIAFMLYHDVWTGSGPVFGLALAPALLYLVGGLYLGAIYLLRGFGLAVGAHACYNVTVLVLLGPA